jgi:tetratricopeptide (TPR) repeat protein
MKAMRALTTRMLTQALFAVLAFTAPRAYALPDLVRADAFWAQRAEGQIDAVARPEPIRAALDGYRAAVAATPDSLEAHWKLQRALWFAGDFAATDPAAERVHHEQAIAAAEAAFAVLARRVGGESALESATPESLREALAPADRSDAAHLYFWSAINLGAWSRLAGLLAAVRAGVATRLHEATLRSIALDPSVEQGGAIRLLSRLHSELPRVPLLSGWVDHTRAIPLAERVLAEYPAHPGNAYLLGLALLGNAPERRAEALGLLERTANIEPRPDHVVEDEAIRIAAREQLDDERRGS